MSSEPLVIDVDSLGKRYEMYAQPADRLRQMILPRLQRVAHRPVRTYFKEFWALRDVSFNVHVGETVGIIGRNGSGKSTLLQMICGTLTPTLGAVHVNGRIAALLELGAGFNIEFTGRENIFLSGMLYGISETELKKRYQSIVDFADIGDFIDAPVKTYSSGMYVRLAFAIIVHMDADTLVVDEALSVGDIRFTQKCMRFLREFQARGTLLFVSHDAGAVLNLCSRAIWLDHGKMMMDGQARDVVERYLAEQHVADKAEVGQRVKVRTVPRRTPAPPSPKAAHPLTVVPRDVRDPRCDLLNGAGSRNVIEVFNFDPSTAKAGFGAGGAKIVDVKLMDEQGEQLRFSGGGEAVVLSIEAVAVTPLDGVILGFYVKDRLGQRLFGDNTYLTYVDRPVHAQVGSHVRASFQFRMPILPVGDYSLDVAVATGTQQEHTQQDWINDALVFKAGDSTMRYGLVGIPMFRIEIEEVAG